MVAQTTANGVQSEGERYYTADSYLLPSDESERTRLQLLHETLKKQFSAELLPPALVLKAGDKILDAGTGSGAWATDVAAHVPPTVSITGIDIEPRLFPTPPPPNTSFHVHSTLSLPPHWSSTFAFAHQRLMIAAFSLSAWHLSIAELFRVLQPGGYLRLEEIDMLRVCPDGLPEPEPPMTRRFREAIGVLCERRDVGAGSLLRVEGMLSEAGFAEVRVVRRCIEMGPGEGGRDARMSLIGAWRGMKVPMLKAGGCGIAQTGEEFDRAVDEVLHEWETCEYGRNFFSWTARKPL